MVRSDLPDRSAFLLILNNAKEIEPQGNLRTARGSNRRRPFTYASLAFRREAAERYGNASHNISVIVQTH